MIQQWSPGREIAGHLARLLVAFVGVWFIGHGVSEAQRLAAVAAELVTGTGLVALSTWWSYRSRRRLLETEPPLMKDT